MAGPVDLLPRHARWQDVNTIPATELSQTMLAVLFANNPGYPGVAADL